MTSKVINCYILRLVAKKRKVEVTDSGDFNTFNNDQSLRHVRRLMVIVHLRTTNEFKTKTSNTVQLKKFEKFLNYKNVI